MKKILMFSLMMILALPIMAAEFEVEGKPMVSLGLRSGTNDDINDGPAGYASLKFSFLQLRGDTTLKVLVPGIGVQAGNGDTNINLSLAPIVIENRAGWGFGIDLFANTKNAKSGKGTLGFFIGKSF